MDFFLIIVGLFLSLYVLFYLLIKRSYTLSVILFFSLILLVSANGTFIKEVYSYSKAISDVEKYSKILDFNHSSGMLNIQGENFHWQIIDGEIEGYMVRGQVKLDDSNARNSAGVLLDVSEKLFGVDSIKQLTVGDIKSASSKEVYESVISNLGSDKGKYTDVINMIHKYEEDVIIGDLQLIVKDGLLFITTGKNVVYY